MKHVSVLVKSKDDNVLDFPEYVPSEGWLLLLILKHTDSLP